jgi:hypothetical protein
MPKSMKNLEDFKTGKCGRPKRWTEHQQHLIDETIPAWHEFGVIKNGSLEGRDVRLLNWKKAQANRLLQSPQFAALPEGVSK